ncbi:hypothetical protein [Sulfitobacter sp. SK011]|uniref:hypothetical protein n=1 Tax=Sulfitobacter sp. SK011 TaxID=1389004 RepID=UPI000E0B7106|nr:hypothetical protein [Sulfitobacter sp. SK011]AXI41796.1 hypothetical protein C1J02_07465 [Sulfitobacter sp. SK011]
MKVHLVASFAIAGMIGTPVAAEWRFNGEPTPMAFAQSGNMSVELQCDRIRFAPTGYDQSEDIVNKQGLSIRFMKDGQTEVGSFQAGGENAEFQIVDNFPVEILFNDTADYGFVLDQIAANAVLNLSMIDQDVSYGFFDLSGSAAAVKSLRSSCAGADAAQDAAAVEAPEGIVYCGGGAIKRQIEYAILENAEDQWDARVTVNGETRRAMTSYSYFGSTDSPAGFVVALLGEDRSEFLVFRDGGRDWIEFGDYTYEQCN